jgi:glycosyltransferase involved in cell wall biosynthesis
MTSVSVAMATFDGQKFIREQLDSLAAQEHLPSELVVTDDASTDKTVAIAQQFAKVAPFPVHIHRADKRAGYRANFMRAAGLCSHDVIAFCDQDDIWLPRKLALCIEPFRDPAVLLVHHNAEVVTDAGKRLGSLNHFASVPMAPPLSLCPIRRKGTPLGFTEVFHRSLLQLSKLREISLDHNNLSKSMAHDQWVFFVASVFGNIVYIDEALAYYRQHGANRFGWDGRSEFLVYLPYLLRSPIEALHAAQQVAERCAAILEDAKAELPDTWHQRASMGAARYRFLAERYTARKRLYGCANLAERVKAFLCLASTGGYRPKRSWGFGRRALLRDLCVGLPAARLLLGADDA